MPTLAQTQQLFWKLITAPEGVAAGLAGLSSSERDAADGLVRPAARLSATERLDVYADMYFYRIRDCLKDDFPAVGAVIGDAAFHNLITDYLLVHPSAHFSLRYVGQRLPAFVSTHELGRRYPCLTDLAALEWSLLEAFDALDAQSITSAALIRIPTARWAELRFTVTPSLKMLCLAWPVHEVWAQTQRQDEVGALEATETFIRVWRQNLRVFHRAIDRTEHAALDALSKGATFADMCEPIAAALGEAAGVERAVALLQGWLADGLLTACVVESADSQ
jgi:Putative DNA-binding domain